MYSSREISLKLVWFPSLGIFTGCQVYCSKIANTDYPIKIQHFHMLGAKTVWYKLKYVEFTTMISVLLDLSLLSLILA